MHDTIPSPLRESLPNWVLLLSVCALIAAWQGPMAAVAFGLAGLVVQSWWMREAPRAVPAQVGAVLSPADGYVVRIEKARDPYADRDALRISVLMSLFARHANRASVDGVVRRVCYMPGHLFNTDLDAASTRHERNAVVIDTNGQLVTLVQIAGLVARRILCRVRTGDTLTRGQRYGRVRFGARVDVYLPTDAVPKVAPGDKVTATTTILATLNKA
jgi:phosphatidylserine decarboxylase